MSTLSEAVTTYVVYPTFWQCVMDIFIRFLQLRAWWHGGIPYGIRVLCEEVLCSRQALGTEARGGVSEFGVSCDYCTLMCL